MPFRIVLALTALAVFAQQQPQGRSSAATSAAVGVAADGTIDLDAPGLQAHASDWHVQGTPATAALVQRTKEALDPAVAERLAAPGAKGIYYELHHEWPMQTSADVLRGLQQRACAADAILIGRITDHKSHLTRSQDNVYTDYAFTVQQTLKGTPARRVILVRRGGKVTDIQNGTALNSLEIEDEESPGLKPNTVYLIFADQIAATRAYVPRAGLDTLVEDASKGQWMMVQHNVDDLVLPELAEGALQANVAGWLNACHQ